MTSSSLSQLYSDFSAHQTSAVSAYVHQAISESDLIIPDAICHLIAEFHRIPTLKAFEQHHRRELIVNGWTRDNNGIISNNDYLDIMKIVMLYYNGSGDDTEYLWLCHLDDESQEVFYERICDGWTTWNRPIQPVQPTWVAHMDKESGQLYYENIDGQHTQWDKPSEFMDPKQNWIGRTDPESGDYYYENIKSAKTQWETPDCFKEKCWQRHRDAMSGRFYWENTTTGTTTWTDPDGILY